MLNMLYMCDMSMWPMWHIHCMACCKREHHEFKNMNRYVQQLFSTLSTLYTYILIDKITVITSTIHCSTLSNAVWTIFELIVWLADGDLSAIPALQSLSFDRGSLGCVHGELQSASLKKLNLWFHVAPEQDDAVDRPALMLGQLTRLLCLHLYYSHTGTRVSPNNMLKRGG